MKSKEQTLNEEYISGIHLEKDMSVPFGHTSYNYVPFWNFMCPKLVECAFFEILCITIKINVQQ